MSFYSIGSASPEAGNDIVTRTCELVHRGQNSLLNGHNTQARAVLADAESFELDSPAVDRLEAILNGWEPGHDLWDRDQGAGIFLTHLAELDDHGHLVHRDLEGMKEGLVRAIWMWQAVQRTDLDGAYAANDLLRVLELMDPKRPDRDETANAIMREACNLLGLDAAEWTPVFPPPRVAVSEIEARLEEAENYLRDNWINPDAFRRCPMPPDFKKLGPCRALQLQGDLKYIAVGDYWHAAFEEKRQKAVVFYTYSLLLAFNQFCDNPDLVKGSMRADETKAAQEGNTLPKYERDFSIRNKTKLFEDISLHSKLPVPDDAKPSKDLHRELRLRINEGHDPAEIQKWINFQVSTAQPGLVRYFKEVTEAQELALGISEAVRDLVARQERPAINLADYLPAEVYNQTLVLREGLGFPDEALALRVC